VYEREGVREWGGEAASILGVGAKVKIVGVPKREEKRVKNDRRRVDWKGKKGNGEKERENRRWC
jgi:hypothetical protein